MAEHIGKRKIKYPVFHDHEGSVRKALCVKNAPRAYLLDEKGKVTWEGWFSGKRIDEVEALVRQSLGLAPKPKREGPAGKEPKPK